MAKFPAGNCCFKRRINLTKAEIFCHCSQKHGRAWQADPHPGRALQPELRFFPGVTKAQNIGGAAEPRGPGFPSGETRPAPGQACYPGRTAPGALGRHVVYASADATTAPSAWAASAARSPLYMRRKEARRGGAARIFTLPRKQSGEESKLTPKDNASVRSHIERR
jgi:hypothetical protein